MLAIQKLQINKIRVRTLYTGSDKYSIYDTITNNY